MIGEENLRIINHARKQVMIRQVVGIGLIMMSFLSIFMFNMGIVIPIGVVILVAIFFFNSNQYKKLYKETIVQGVYQNMFDKVTYRSEQGFEKEWVREQCLISMGNRYSSDDYLSGFYKGVHFVRSDVTMQDHRSSGKSSYTVTLFKGQWMVFDFPKVFQSYTKVVEKEFLNSGKPSIFSMSVDKIETENVAFNQLFGIYTTNEHDAFYLLTPHFMEKLMDIEKRYSGKMTVGFINGKLHLLLYTNENAFEPPIFEEVTEKDAFICEQQAKIICEIIDCLDLYRK